MAFNSDRHPSFFNFQPDKKLNKSNYHVKFENVANKTAVENYLDIYKTPFNTPGYLLYEENKKLRNEILSIKESFLKQKEELITKIDKQNEIIYDLTYRLNYGARNYN